MLITRSVQLATHHAKPAQEERVRTAQFAQVLCSPIMASAPIHVQLVSTE